MDELKDILFDTVGEYVNPDSLTIREMPNGYYMVLSNTWILGEDRKQAQDDLDRRLVGTKYENKVNLYWPVD